MCFCPCSCWKIRLLQRTRLAEAERVADDRSWCDERWNWCRRLWGGRTQVFRNCRWACQACLFHLRILAMPASLKVGVCLLFRVLCQWDRLFQGRDPRSRPVRWLIAHYDDAASRRKDLPAEHFFVIPVEDMRECCGASGLCMGLQPETYRFFRRSAACRKSRQRFDPDLHWQFERWFLISEIVTPLLLLAFLARYSNISMILSWSIELSILSCFSYYIMSEYKKQ